MKHDWKPKPLDEKRKRNAWKTRTPVNMALELNDDRDDEITQQVHITDPDIFGEDFAKVIDALEDEEPTQRRRVAHSFSGVIDELKGKR